MYTVDDLASPTGRIIPIADAVTKEFLGSRRHAELSLEDIKRVGDAYFGDPNGLGLYGRPPSRWYAAGIRIAGHTAVEATPDAYARRIATNVRDHLAEIANRGSMGVVDLFAGSGNLMFHLSTTLGVEAVGIEIDPQAWRLTAVALERLGNGRHQLRLGSWESYFDRPLDVDTAVFVVAPPWGDAFSFSSGLDLRGTKPSVLDVLRHIEGCRSGQRRFAVIQVPTHEPLVPASRDALLERYRLVGSGPSYLLVAVG